MQIRIILIAAVYILTARIPLATQTIADELIYPDPGKKIILVQAGGKSDGLLKGERINQDDPLAAMILEELSLPFQASIIKLSQCSRNLVSDFAGPNVLFLSQTEGGFPRQGLILQDEGKSTAFPNLFFVDLVLDSRRIEEGELDIFSHELGHVMMLNIWQNIPDQYSVKQHVSMGVTDYTTAIYEGWGVHFQRLTYDAEENYREKYLETWDYNRGLRGLWHSNLDEELRLNAVLQNRYIHRKQLPGVDLSKMNLEELILLEHTSPLFDVTGLKNAQQMLSCEGVLATLFYRINTNEILQNNYNEKSFYRRFLTKPLPMDMTPQEIFTPFENVMLKHFWVWSKLDQSLSADAPIFIEYIKQWAESFPDDREEIYKLFVLTTAGKTMTDELGRIYEKIAYFGMIGEIQKFRELMPEYQSILIRLLEGLKEGSRLLDGNLGPQIWVENPDFLIRRTLWDPEQRAPLWVNLNTASVFELESFPGIDRETARKIIKKREDIGFFRSREEAEKYGFKVGR